MEGLAVDLEDVRGDGALGGELRRGGKEEEEEEFLSVMRGGSSQFFLLFLSVENTVSVFVFFPLLLTSRWSEGVPRKSVLPW